MSISFRKSKKIGPFRISLSKRGISTSIGEGSVRVTANRNGIYASAGADGVRDREKLADKAFWRRLFHFGK